MLCKSQISRSVAVELPKMGTSQTVTATHFYNDTIHSPTHTRQLHIFAHFVGGVKEEEKKYLEKTKRHFGSTLCAAKSPSRVIKHSRLPHK